MKKILIVVFLSCCFAVQAQHDSIPYNIGIPQFFVNHPFDSMHYSKHDGTDCYPALFYLNNNSFLYQGWGGALGMPAAFAIMSEPDGELAFGFYPDSTIHLIGVAFCNVNGTDDLADTFAFYYDTIGFDSVDLKVYAPNGPDMNLVAMGGITKSNMISYSRLYFPYLGWDSVDLAPAGGSTYSGRFAIRELYFENEIDVSDSIYISLQYRNRNPNSGAWIPGVTGWAEFHWPQISPDIRIWPVQSYRVRHCAADCPWIYGEQHSYPLLFPIIRRDCDSCPQVRGMQHIKAAANKVIFKWQRGTNHHDWQLSYGPAGTAPEAGTIVDVNQVISNSITFDPDSHYVAYVRARCRFARYEYGPWSDPYTFSINGGNGIDDVSSNDVTLTPNPAAERVTVSAKGMQSIELLGVDGTVILRREGLMQDEYILDLKGLAAGVYMVRVSTAKGTATRRLMVQ